MDTTPPSLTLRVSDAPDLVVAPLLQNPSFETGDFTGWDVGINADAVVLDTTADVGVAAPDGDYVARIGRPTNPGQPATVNVISQEIPASARSISFQYNFHTTDTAPFDEPAMFVYVNGREVARRWAMDVPSEGAAGVRSSGWQREHVFLGDIGDTTLQIAFHAGNGPGQQYQQSWMYLDDLRTTDVVTTADAVIMPESEGVVEQLLVEEWLDGWQEYLFTAVDAVGNSISQRVRLLRDDTAPAAIQDLVVSQQGTALYQLTFTAPSDEGEGSVRYDIRVADTEQTLADAWQSATVVQPNSSERMPAARPAGTHESMFVEIPPQFTEGIIGVKSIDAAGNWSGPSLVPLRPPTATVTLTEIFPAPESTAVAPLEREWLELQNTTGTAIDVSQWYLRDAAEHIVYLDDQMVLHADGRRDRHVAAGERVLLQLSNALLNNNGDTIELFEPQPRRSGDMLHFYHTYADSAVEVGESLVFDPGSGAAGLWIAATPSPFISTQQLSDAANAPTPVPATIEAYGDTAEALRIEFTPTPATNAVSYSITYSHGDASENDVRRAGFRDVIALEADEDMEAPISISDIPFETCSNGGTHCVTHEHVHDVTVTVVLQQEDGSSEYLVATALPGQVDSHAP